MAARRPIVIVNGKLRQLPAGDTLAAPVGELSVVLADAEMTYLPLDARGEIPIQLADGSLSSLPTIGGLYG